MEQDSRFVVQPVPKTIILMNAMRGAFLCLTLVHGTLAFGQVRKITDASEFADSISLSFQEFTIPVGADNAYTSFGVAFDGELGSTPMTVIWDPGQTSFNPDIALRNVGEESSQPDSALITRFRYPVVRAAFRLANGHEDTIATIQAIAPNGDLLGEIEQAGVDTDTPVFVGFETSNTAGMATVILDYGDGAAEQTSSLDFDYLEPRPFRTHLAQIANGPAGTDRSLQTVLQFQGLVEYQETNVVLRLFDQSGNPLPLDLSGEKANVLEFTLVGGTAKRLVTDGTSNELAVGYASIQSNLPLAAQSIVRTLGVNGLPIHEAGAEAIEGKPTVRIPVEHDPVTGLNSGVAVVNVGTRKSLVVIGLVDESGERPLEFENAPDFFLEPGEHRAVFLTELFEFLRDEAFFGSLSVISQEPAAVTSLRTYKGVSWSSLPVGSTQK